MTAVGELLSLVDSLLFLVLAHDVLEGLVVKVPTALVLGRLVDALWASSGLRYDKRFLVSRSGLVRLHRILVLLADLLVLLLLREPHYDLIYDFMSLILVLRLGWSLLRLDLNRARTLLLSKAALVLASVGAVLLLTV